MSSKKQIVITIVATIPEGATAGRDYDNQPLTQEFVRDYLVGAYQSDGPCAELVPGLVVDQVRTEPMGLQHLFMR